MSIVQNQLFCSWHVDRAWQSNLSKLPVDLRSIIYKSIKILQYNLDCKSFESQLEKFLQKLLEDNETKNFGIYFKNYYYLNCKQWAMCYRKQSGINTNMRLESMHKCIKYFYLNKRKIKRLDLGLNALLKYTRDKMVERVIKLTKGKKGGHQMDIANKHRLAAKSNHEILPLLENKWKIKNITKKMEYIVQRNQNFKCCYISCDTCKICLHMYSCTCLDYFVKSLICIHVHSVLIWINKNERNCCDEPSFDKADMNLEINKCLTTISNDNLDSSNKHFDTIQSKLASIQSVLESFTEEEIDLLESGDRMKQITSHLKTVELHLLACKNNVKPVTKFISKTITTANVSGNIQPQKRFYSTKRRRKTITKHMTKPSITESETILGIINGEETLYISTDPANDHSY